MLRPHPRRCAHAVVLCTLVVLGACTGPLSVPEIEIPTLELRDASLPELTLPRPGQALAWAQPIDVGGVVIRVPAPAGYEEVCANDTELRESLKRTRKNLQVLACYRPQNGGAVATLSTLAQAQAVDSAEFVRYKQSLAARATLIHKAATSYTGGTALSQFESSQAEVLKVLRSSKDWVVHAVVRAGERGPEQGVSVSVWIRERLLYLTQFDTRAPDWPALTEFGQDFATATIGRTLWSRPN